MAAPQAFTPTSMPPATLAAPYAPVVHDVAGAGASLPPGVTAARPMGRLGANLLESLLVMVTLGIGWIIWAAIIGGTGQTPAKKIIGHRVIVADTMRPAGLGRMFWMRGLVAGFVAGLAITLTLGILLFMPFWDRRNQNVWDKVSSCYVVKDPNDAWSTKPHLA